MTNNSDILNLVRKREKLLNNIAVFQDAFELMLKNQNFKQIKEMFESTLNIQKKIDAIDSELEKNKKIIYSSKEIQSKLIQQAELTKKILEKEKKIKEKLTNTISKIGKELSQINLEKNITSSYAKNILNKNKPKLDKKI